MANETCQHCGAGRTNGDKYVEWTCGSLQWGQHVRRTDLCETRQELAEVTAERDALARRIAEAPVRQVIDLADGSATMLSDGVKMLPETRKVRLLEVQTDE